MSSPIVATRSHVAPTAPHVLRDVARAAERVAPLADAHDGDRRLGRDALDVAAQVDVEHRVAEHRDATARRGLEELDQSIAIQQPATHGEKVMNASRKRIDAP